MKGDWNPKTYYDDGRVLKWGENISPENSEAMNNGEVFTLLNEEGKPHAKILKDSYGTIRERICKDDD